MRRFGGQLPLKSEKKREKKVLRILLLCFPSYGQNIEEAVRFSHKLPFVCHDKNEKISSGAVRLSPRAESEVFHTAVKDGTRNKARIKKK